GRIPDIRTQYFRVTACGPNLAGDSLRAIFIKVDDDDGGSFLRHPLCGRFSDSRSGTSYDCNPVLEPHVLFTSVLWHFVAGSLCFAKRIGALRSHSARVELVDRRPSASEVTYQVSDDERAGANGFRERYR